MSFLAHGRKQLLHALIVSLGTQIYCSAASAGETTWDRFTFTVGGFRPSITTEIRLDVSPQAPGSYINLEQDLQLNDSEILTQYYASFRITPRISIEANFFEIGRSAQSQLSGAIQFGDTLFPINTAVSTAFDTSVATIGLRWSFLQTEHIELAATGGAYWMSIEAGIESSGSALNEIAKADSPLPMAGLSFGWNLTPKLQLMIAGEYLPVDYADFDGVIASYRSGLRFSVFENLGVGVGYDILDVDVDSQSSSFSGFVKYRQQGPKAFVSMRF